MLDRSSFQGQITFSVFICTCHQPIKYKTHVNFITLSFHFFKKKAKEGKKEERKDKEEETEMKYIINKIKIETTKGSEASKQNTNGNNRGKFNDHWPQSTLQSARCTKPRLNKAIAVIANKLRLVVLETILVIASKRMHLSISKLRST